MNFNEVKELINIFDKSSLSFMELDIDNCHICMDKAKGRLKNEDERIITENAVTEVREKDPMEINTPIEVKKKEDKKLEGRYITSPIVGTFYAAPSPDKDAFVKIGDRVKQGDVICIIESMKLMNEIESDLDGEIAEILVEDGAMVEFGQNLFRII